jgi:NADH:ubiquinone oxidoreductase subunit F (NADH-binding)
LVVVPISGEETALIESLEGKKKRKTQPPPFPAVSILRANPTVVNVGNYCISAMDKHPVMIMLK